MTEIDEKKFREAEKVVKETLDLLFLKVKKYYEGKMGDMTVVVSKEKIRGYKGGVIISFSDNLKIGELDVTVNFSKGFDKWSYEIDCDQLDRKYLSPSKELSFHGQIRVLFTTSETDKNAIQKKQVIVL